jgi:hypothetical protein
VAKADLERAKALYPSCSMAMDEWMTFFATSAGLRAMGRIIYDVYDEVISREERENGKRRIGRRPAREATSLAKVMAVVRPEEFTNEPLPIALKALMRGRSERAFARKVPISQSHLNRLLTASSYSPDAYPMELLESLAEAGSVHPWHFPEWRAQFIGQLVTETLKENPALGITALRALRNGRREADERSPEPLTHKRGSRAESEAS